MSKPADSVRAKIIYDNFTVAMAGLNLLNSDASENAVIDFNSDITFEFKEYFEFVHRVEWPDIITYSWAPKRQNLNANLVWMAKNKREQGSYLPAGHW